MLKTKIFLLIAGALFIVGCSDAPSPIGVDQLGNDLLKIRVIDSQSDTLTQTSASFRKISPLGASAFVLLGNALGVKADMLLQFNLNFDETTVNALKKDSILLSSARIVLKKVYAIGDSTQSFPVAMVNGYRVTSSWDPLKVKADSLPNIDISSDILSAKPAPDSLYYFGVRNDLALQWMKNSYDTVNFKNDGLMLRAETATPYLIGFQGFSSTGENAPKIELTFKYLATNKDTTISFRTLSDAHVVHGGTPALQADEIIVQSGTAIESRIYFDLTKLPANVFINNAELILTADSTKQRIGNSALNGLLVSIFDDLTNDSTFTKNALYNTNMYLSKGRYSGNLTTVLRQIYLSKKNYGFLISTSNSIEGLETIYLKGSNATEALRPKLIITYTKLD